MAPRPDPPTEHRPTAHPQDVWEVMSTARAIRRFTDEPVPDDVLRRCLQAATWAPSGGNFQAWRFVILRSPEVRAAVGTAAAMALEVIESVYKMHRPGPDEDDRKALGAAKTTIAQAIEKELAEVDGTFVDAELEEEDGTWYWQVSVDTDDTDTDDDDREVRVDVRSGKVTLDE